MWILKILKIRKENYHYCHYIIHVIHKVIVCFFQHFSYLAFHYVVWQRQTTQLEQQQESPNNWIREL